MSARAASLLVAIVLACLAVPSTASATHTNLAVLINDATNRCLAVQGSADYNGSPAFQYDCMWGWLDQQWYVVPVGPNDTPPYIIENRDSKMCLAIQSSRKDENGAPAFEHTCMPGWQDQQWDLSWQTYYGKRQIQNVASRKCLAIASTTADYSGSPAFQYDCMYRYKDQGWYFDWL